MAELIFKIDGFVFDLEEEGYDFQEIITAIIEYVEISEEVLRA